MECRACEFVGLTAYGQCQKCGIRHKIRVIEWLEGLIIVNDWESGRTKCICGTFYDCKMCDTEKALARMKLGDIWSAIDVTVRLRVERLKK